MSWLMSLPPERNAEAGDDDGSEASEDKHCLHEPVGGEERRGAGGPWCPGVARFPGSPPGGGRVSDDRRLGWRGVVVVAAAAGAVDAGGGGPLVEDFGVGA